jgi:hypothetical protein
MEGLRGASTEGLRGASIEGRRAGVDVVCGLDEFKGRWEADAEVSPWEEAGVTVGLKGILAGVGLIARLGVGDGDWLLWIGR